MSVEITTVTSLDYLLIPLRLHLGDTSDTPRYTDGFLRIALVEAVKGLMKRWNDRYLIDSSTYIVSRNTMALFDYAEPPVIQIKDERAIVLQSSIFIKSGLMEEGSYDFGSWKDEEVSVSNIEGSRSKSLSLQNDMEELNSLFPRRLAKAKKQSLRGYINPPNTVENS